MRTPAGYTVAILIMLVGLAGCINPVDPAGKDAARIGALVPFTGDLAVSGINIERALILAAEAATRSGGIGGKPVVVISQDTHDAATPFVELDRAVTAAQHLMQDIGVIGVIGPETSDIAQRVVAIARSTNTVNFIGGLLPPTAYSAYDRCTFHILPSVSSLSMTLAKRMRADGINRLTVLYNLDTYGATLGRALADDFKQLGGDPGFPISFQPNQATYQGLIRDAIATQPQAIVLVGYPETTAHIMQEYLVLGTSVKWYFAPTLQSQGFLNNVPQALVDGAIGVAPGLSAAPARAFSDLFQQRFSGDVPLTNAYYYYDSMALLLLAVAAAEHAALTTPSYREICDQIQKVAGPGGEVVTWDQLDRGIALARSGKMVNYEGLTGTVEIDSNGEGIATPVTLWTIRNGRIETIPQ
ncbi:MAG: ABC transporter substrate-binding protein [Myxococcales bacterium]|jgi:ABC-type branched-subunit amino acid transport system substrate-binding protein|nr:ABC transporter substrate-binding protein [Myxococcales bacterium]